MINLLIDNPPKRKEHHQYAENPPQIFQFKTPECSKKNSFLGNRVDINSKFNFFSSPHFLDSSPMSSLSNRQKCQVAHEKTDATQLTDLLFIVCAPLIYLSFFRFRITAWLCETNNGLELRTLESPAFLFHEEEKHFKSL